MTKNAAKHVMTILRIRSHPNESSDDKQHTRLHTHVEHAIMTKCHDSCFFPPQNVQAAAAAAAHTHSVLNLIRSKWPSTKQQSLSTKRVNYKKCITQK